MMDNIDIWTDGSCYNRGGNKLSFIGGIGIVIVDDGELIEISEGPFKDTTSARMEIKAILRAMEIMGGEDHMITIHSDNQYCTKALNEGLVFNWEKQEWAERANADLWKEFLEIYRSIGENVKLVWVRGHDGDANNEIADRLADEGRKK